MQEIVLAPLGRDDVGQLVADALHCEPARAAPLAQLVHEKTGGNPFFAIQFLAALAEEGCSRSIPTQARWPWDIDAHPRQELHRQRGGSHGRRS